MNRNDFKNPLIQSGAVLLAVFILISIVAASGPDSFIGSLAALVTGLLKGILFIVALGLGIIISIAIIIGIYVAAVSSYSMDRGREIIAGLQNVFSRLFDITAEQLGSLRRWRTTRAVTGAGPKAPAETAAGEQTENRVQEQIGSLKGQLQAVTARFEELKKSVATGREHLEKLTQRFDRTADKSEVSEDGGDDGRMARVEAELAAITARLDNGDAEMAGLRKDLETGLQAVRDDLAALHEKTAVPETVSGILSYIDRPEDRELVTAKATEAVSRGMTYTQTDEFFASSLPREVYEELAAHPRLTKDFLRSIKKKF